MAGDQCALDAELLREAVEYGEHLGGEISHGEHDDRTRTVAGGGRLRQDL